MQQIKPVDVFSGLLQLAMHAENTSWNRFYNFLMGNSILVLAWATIYVSSTHSVMSMIVMIAICLLGGISGPPWSNLGVRGRESLREYCNTGLSLENDSSIWPKALDKYKVFNLITSVRDSLPNPKSGSYTLLKTAPWGFSVLYAVLVVATVVKYCSGAA